MKAIRQGASSRAALTLIEVLVVIAIIGVLIALMMPAVEMGRTSARRLQCTNQVKQLAVAVQAHVATFDHFPAGGWNWEWVGDPDRGFGKDQPGGWIFNILPFIEESELRDYSDVAETEEQRRRLAAKAQQTPIAILAYPSRRAPLLYERDWNWTGGVKNAERVKAHAKTDYAINGGDVYVNLGPSPDSYDQVDNGDYEWPERLRTATGICNPHSLLRPARIVDGNSKTYLLGEKYLPVRSYTNGHDVGDDSTMLQGDDMDITRWTVPVVTDKFHHLIEHDNRPQQDQPEAVSPYAFGSAHPDGWNVAMCDGSVQFLGYDLDPEVHRASGNREDANR